MTSVVPSPSRMDRLRRVFVLSLLIAIVPAEVSAESGPAPLLAWEAVEARQAVAVDSVYAYVVSNHAIGKYEKATGKRVATWEGPEGGPIVHLNSARVLDGKLYCAHSNYPEIPMQGSVEIWDTKTLEHVDSFSFGIGQGSLTWIDHHDGHWWAGFGMYNEEKAEPGKDPAWTQVVRLDDQWRRVEGWVFPKEIIEKFRPMTNSGASWGPDGLLYTTGHDHFEAYVMRLPKAGSVLELVQTVPVASFGQGIAFDDWSPGGKDLWGIIKDDRMVLVSRIE